ncbi:MAG: outer membrane beta-barrel domain-containing protein, partial [Proteobacteria bacterium]|nr:outer membrane beta-barrel domain-containing protein [Pseudomonadota bacterium]
INRHALTASIKHLVAYSFDWWYRQSMCGEEMLAEMAKDKKRFIPKTGLNIVGVDTHEVPGEQLYLIAGLGSTRFAGDDRFTVNVGAGYRLLLTDSVAFHVDFRDHLFDIDLFGEEKTAHNLEAHIGVTVFF